jgi:hypothetical protein
MIKIRNSHLSPFERFTAVSCLGADLKEILKPLGEWRPSGRPQKQIDERRKITK